jgi:hypothetical protein
MPDELPPLCTNCKWMTKATNGKATGRQSAPLAGYVAGQKVKAKVACHNGLSEEGIGGYCCIPGDVLVIRAVGDRNSNNFNWDYWVSHESVTNKSFGVNDYEIEPHNDEAHRLPPTATVERKETDEIKSKA